MKPEYTVKKSIWGAVTPLRVIFCWLIIPLIIMIAEMVSNNCTTIEFYKDKVVAKSGVLNKKERTNVFTGVLAVSVEQSIFGRMLNYGNVIVDVQGKWDISTEKISDPDGLKSYLEGRTVQAQNINFIAQA